MTLFAATLDAGIAAGAFSTLGAAFALCALFARPGQAMRWTAFGASLLSLAVAGALQQWPLAAAHAVLAPLSLWRALAMRRRLAEIAAVTENDAFAAEWARAALRRQRIAAGAALFQRGEPADDAWLILSGAIDVPEAGARLGPGALVGEMGLFAYERRRTASAVAASDAELLRVPYRDLESLYAFNPAFGLHLTQLMVRRLQPKQADLAA